MTSILVKDLPDELHQRLKVRARRNRRSMAKEILELISGSLEDRSGPPSLEEIDRLRVAGSRPLTQAVLDEALRDGRR
jgi:plasmid stability protein